MMLLFQKANKCILFLFLLLYVSSYTYGDNSPSPLDHINTSNELFGMINPNPMRENHFFDQKNRKTTGSKKHVKLSYYLYVDDFIKSFIEIPTNNVSKNSSTISSKYLAGRAALYNTEDEKVGTCSASFLCMKNKDGIFTDISNYISVDDNGLIVSWFTPSTLINLELDSIIHSMVTECMVLCSTKIGFSLFYGKKFNMIVSSDDKKIYFNLTEI